MQTKADAVVIGGGIMGASTAHFLAKLGFGDIVLLESRKLAAVSTALRPGRFVDGEPLSSVWGGGNRA